MTVAPGKIPNFEANCAKFWTEHLHKEEEIRFIIDGVGKSTVFEKTIAVFTCLNLFWWRWPMCLNFLAIN